MHPRLQRAAERRLGVFTAEEARRAGYRRDQIRTALRSRQWTALRRGIYIQTERLAQTATDPRARHLVDCVAVLAALDDGPVISHESAARTHGLVLPRTVDDTVRLTDPMQWRTGRGYRIARASLPPSDVVRTPSFPVTAIPRTLVDCAREWPLVDAVVAIDAAIFGRLVTRPDLRSAVLAASHWEGIGNAGQALHLSDGRAESPLETRTRLALVAGGLPTPELQVEIHGARGLLGRVDAWYEEAAIAVECDGRVKYADPRGGRSPADVAWDEKRREDTMRELGVRFVRFVDEDSRRLQGEMLDRLGRMLAVPFTGPRRFRIVRTLEYGAAAATDDVA
jgi:hypothetical protein